MSQTQVEDTAVKISVEESVGLGFLTLDRVGAAQSALGGDHA